MKEEPRDREHCQNEVPKPHFGQFLPPGFHISETASIVIILSAHLQGTSYPTKQPRMWLTNFLPTSPPACYRFGSSRQTVFGRWFLKILYSKSKTVKVVACKESHAIWNTIQGKTPYLTEVAGGRCTQAPCLGLFMHKKCLEDTRHWQQSMSLGRKNWERESSWWDKDLHYVPLVS